MTPRTAHGGKRASQPANVGAMLLAELHHADHIIKAMLNAMTDKQKATVSERLEAAGVTGEGMTRHHERLAAMEAAQAGADEHTGAGGHDVTQQMRGIETRAIDITMKGQDIEILLQALFEKLDDMNPATAAAPAVAAINCFATCVARNAVLIGEAAGDIAAFAHEGCAT